MTQIVRTCSECDLAYFDNFAEGRVDQVTGRLTPFIRPTDPYRDVLMDFRFLREDQNICQLCLAEDNLDDLGMYSPRQREDLGMENMAEQEKAAYIRAEQRRTDLYLKRGWEQELENRRQGRVDQQPIDLEVAYSHIFTGVK